MLTPIQSKSGHPEANYVLGKNLQRCLNFTVYEDRISYIYLKLEDHGCSPKNFTDLSFCYLLQIPLLFFDPTEYQVRLLKWGVVISSQYFHKSPKRLVQFHHNFKKSSSCYSTSIFLISFSFVSIHTLKLAQWWPIRKYHLVTSTILINLISNIW